MVLLSRENISSRIEKGEILVIRHGKVLKLNKWIPKHPGGDKAILHMVGRDASDEIDVYHSEETLMKMESFSIGTVQLPWENLIPPIQQGDFETAKLGKQSDKVVKANLERELQRDIEKYPSVDDITQRKIQSEFRKLHAELTSEGFFECNYWAYAWEALRIGSLLCIAAYFFFFRYEKMWRLLVSATSLGLAWHQLVFIAHDAGHLSITHNYWVDNFIGAFLASFIGGLSLGWWKRNHNVHHLVTNDPVHDPDIQHLPFFAVTSRLFKNVCSTFYEKTLVFDVIAKAMLPLQHHLYYPILCFGRFNLYRLSWEYVLYGLGPREGQAKYLRHFELLGLSVFMFWFFYLAMACGLHSCKDRVLYILWSHIVTMPVHVQITLSHFAQSTSDLGPKESFAQRQVRTTMDVACPAWLDYIHGGLQFQAIHHLFPRMPRHNFRAAQSKVVKFCEALGLHYEIYGFTTGNKHVIDRLYDVAQQAAVFNECNKFCEREIMGTS